MADDVMEYLKKEGPIFDKEMERILPRKKEPKEVYGLIWEHLDRGGKRLRPVLCKISCEAVGGDGKKTLSAGAGLEFFHNFTLMHDDIMDASETRRGKTCTYVTYGIPLAMNAGDELFVLGLKAVLESNLPNDKIVSISKIFARVLERAAEGQALELGWYKDGDFNISEDKFLYMAEGKTGALIGAACEIGAIIGDAKPEELSALSQFGRSIGVVFQIQDDVLNLIGDEKKYGKEIGGDITEGKRSLITIHAYEHAAPADKKRLVELLRSHTHDKEKISEAIAICNKYGSIEYAKNRAIKIAEDAKEGIMILRNNEASRRLLQLANFVIYREV